MDTRTKEAIRYLGYGTHAVDDDTLALVKESFEELSRIAKKKIVYRIFDLSISRLDCLSIGILQIKSSDLAKNMKGCTRVVILGATLGVQVDRQMKRLSISNMAKAVVWQACGAALLEEFLDDCQKRMAVREEQKGWYLRPRFSPGYGDFALSHQAMILRMLDAEKTIGLTTTRGGMLTPSKSVTAVIGLGTTKVPCHIKGCEVCGKADCIYRR